MAGAVGIECEDRLEGRIADLLVQLPDDGDESRKAKE
jgi:hypothetical protein